MTRFLQFVRHMFALTSPLPPDEEAKFEPFLRRAAETVVRRRMAIPVSLFLEMYKPVSLLGHQALLVLEPMLRLLFSPADLTRLATLLEERGRIERFIQLILEVEQERTGPPEPKGANSP